VALKYLAFDDFGKGHSTPWVMLEYSSLFGYRAMAGLPTFLTTNLSPKQMREQYGDYLIGRMLAHCQVLHVEGVDTRFISVLLENPDLSPEDLGMVMEDEGGMPREPCGWLARRVQHRWKERCLPLQHPSRAASVRHEPYLNRSPA
jgi:hypothetical protein